MLVWLGTQALAVQCIAGSCRIEGLIVCAPDTRANASLGFHHQRERPTREKRLAGNNWPLDADSCCNGDSFLGGLRANT
jgi:hypothetical protein